MKLKEISDTTRHIVLERKDVEEAFFQAVRKKYPQFDEGWLLYQPEAQPSFVIAEKKLPRDIAAGREKVP
jgi:hypothetical protein